MAQRMPKSTHVCGDREQAKRRYPYSTFFLCTRTCRIMPAHAVAAGPQALERRLFEHPGTRWLFHQEEHTWSACQQHLQECHLSAVILIHKCSITLAALTPPPTPLCIANLCAGSSSQVLHNCIGQPYTP